MLGLRWSRDADPAASAPQVIKGGLADIWGDKPLASLDSHDIHAIVDEARKLGIPGLGKRNNGVSESRGRKMHAALNIFFRWALRQRRLTVNPCSGVWHPGPPPARDRVLSDQEIRAFWLATDEVGQPFASALKLLVLSGCRLGEVAGMRRDELAANGIWTISGTRTKNHRQHIVPLPPMAQEIIANAPRVEGSYVFTTTGTSSVSGWSKCKRELDEQMGAPPWRLHDLRRTCASGMQRLGVRVEVIERALNHISGSYGGVARYVPVKTVLLGAAKEATRVPQNLRANERIGICAHHNGPRLPTWGPTDNISFRRIARHGCYARRRVRVSLPDIGALPVRLPSIGR
jgi:integrase